MDIDRLVRGYVREELRSLWKSQDPKGALIQVFDPLTPLFTDGTLNEATLRRYQQRIRNGMDQLGVFGLQSSRSKLNGMGATSNIKSFYFWQQATFEFNHITENKEKHIETLMRLAHMNFALDKKRLVADEIECSVMLNDHTLCRMIERGCVKSKPLAFVNSEIDNWFPYAAANMVLRGAIDSPVSSTIIPFGAGAFLAKLSFIQTVYSSQPSGCTTRPNWSTHLNRLVLSHKHHSVGDIPVPDPLQSEYEGKDGRCSVHISTWIHQAQFSTDQWWSYQKITDLANKYPDVMAVQPSIIHSFHQITINVKRFAEFTESLTDIVNNPRWIRACRL